MIDRDTMPLCLVLKCNGLWLGSWRDDVGPGLPLIFKVN